MDDFLTGHDVRGLDALSHFARKDCENRSDNETDYTGS